MEDKSLDPLLSKEFIDYFLKLDIKNKNLVEIGIGPSTLFWGKYFKQINGYENDLNYYQSFLKKTAPLKNVTLHHYDKTIFNSDDFKIKIFEADYILIDNNPAYLERFIFAKFAVEHKNPHCCIILDNGNWNRQAHDYLSQQFYCKDFLGINMEKGKLYKYPTITTIFFKRKEDIN